LTSRIRHGNLQGFEKTSEDTSNQLHAPAERLRVGHVLVAKYAFKVTYLADQCSQIFSL
jgi:hypothetical protein